MILRELPLYLDMLPNTCTQIAKLRKTRHAEATKSLKGPERNYTDKLKMFAQREMKEKKISCTET